MKLTTGINNLWPTPVYYGTIENKELLDNVCQQLLISSSITSTFQEYDPLADEEDSTMQQFKNQVVWPAFTEYFDILGIDISKFPARRLRSWLSGVSNYMIPVHNHSNAVFSAVFYLLSESSARAGELILVDPKTNANRGYKAEFKHLFENKIFSPSSGEYLILPSYVYHHTVPFTGSIRLAMPVDLFL